MFNLIYRDGAPENTGHYEGIPTDSTTLKVGQAVHLASGKAVLANGDAKVYGVVAGDAADGVVKVLKVTPDMIFETITTFSPAAKGTVVTISAGEKVTANSPASGRFGAKIVDNRGATAGGFVEVCFEN